MQPVGGALIISHWRHLQRPLFLKGEYYLWELELGVLEAKKPTQLNILIPYW